MARIAFAILGPSILYGAKVELDRPRICRQIRAMTDDIGYS